MWSAYRWGIAQRPRDGNIFQVIERQGLRKLAEERAKEAHSLRVVIRYFVML
jgi:hypothetical protein